MTNLPAHANPAKPRRWRWVVLAMVASGLVFVGLFAWDGYRLLNSVGDLESYATGAQQAVDQRDATALAQQVTGLQDAADTFAQATVGPHWWVASHVPWVKNQTVPLQRAGQAVRAVADDALGPLADLGDLSALEAPPVVDGRIDPYFLEPYREVLSQADTVLKDQTEALAAVNLTGTVEQVREPFVALETKFVDLGSLVDGAHVAAELLPSMLGGQGTRSYIVMVQNNAEPRTSGGIPGSVIGVSVEDGRMALHDFVGANSMSDTTQVVTPLTEDEERIFTTRMAMYPQDVNFTAEFPRAAQIMAAFWERETGQTPDGVISIDPVAFQYMLAGMEPTEVDGVQITQDTVAQVLLSQAYWEYPEPEQSDAFFAAASRELFGALLGGTTSPVAGLERAIDERRFLVWSGNEAEQNLLLTTPIGADFIQDEDTVGVFLNDGSGSKIGYYIDTSVTVVNRLCTDGTLGGQTVSVTLHHGFDGDVAQMPTYVSGGDVFVPAGDFQANLLLYPQVGTTVREATADGAAAALNPEIHHGRAVFTGRVELAPGQSTTVTYDLDATESGVLPGNAYVTPGPAPTVPDVKWEQVASGC